MITLPFSFKIIFAPLLDTYYSSTFGKRKSYIIPLQYLLTLSLLITSFHIQHWITHKDIYMLTTAGLINILIVATQDIAVDGIVLTILPETLTPNH
jgi:PAT family acetyl-CoA transporter-like MFS transporter 1